MNVIPRTNTSGGYEIETHNDSIDDDLVFTESVESVPILQCNHGSYNTSTHTCKCFSGWIDDWTQEIDSDLAFCSVRSNMFETVENNKRGFNPSNSIILIALICLTVLMSALCVWLACHTLRRQTSKQRRSSHLGERQKSSRDSHTEGEHTGRSPREADADALSDSTQNEPFAPIDMRRRNAIHPSHPYYPRNTENQRDTQPSSARVPDYSSLDGGHSRGAVVADTKHNQSETEASVVTPDHMCLYGHDAWTTDAPSKFADINDTTHTNVHYDPENRDTDRS